MPEVKLPTAEELSELPHRLIVAYAVACAKRLYFFAEENLRPIQLEVVVNAIAFADEFSKSGNIIAAAYVDDTAIADNGYGPNPMVGDAIFASLTANSAAASDAANAAAHAVNAANATKPDRGIYAANLNLDDLDAAARAYFERLVELAKTSTVLNIDIPVWPLGEPEWSLELKKKVAEKRANEEAKEIASNYKVIRDRGGELSHKEVALEFEEVEHGLFEIKFEFPDDASDEEIEKLAVEFVRDFNRRYQEEGGLGLTIDDVLFERPTRVTA